MKTNKIIWSLLSTILAINYHSVDAASNSVLAEIVATNQKGQENVSYAKGKLAKVEALAIELIDKQVPEQAISLLEPYIDNHTATEDMQETYIQAMFKTGTDSLLIQEANRIWSNHEKMPVAVRKIVADSYLRLGKMVEALHIFRQLMQEQPQNREANANLAYALLYSGQTLEGLGVYDKLLRENPDMVDVFIEDAVALLSQGNVFAGRSLFENILSVYPEKIEYRQRYAESLAMYQVEGPAKEQYQQLAKDEKITEKEQRSQMYDKAIQLAREQQYTEALPRLRWLHENDFSNYSISFDYITVLHWAGKEQEAIELYEQLSKVDVPDYVRQNVADAYYQIGNYSNALRVVQSLSQRGEGQGKLREAECFMRLGEFPSAQLIYEELLGRNPKDLEVYLSRASLAPDTKQAVWNLEQALSGVPQIPENQMRIRQIKADLAAGYINLGYSQKAILLLLPYINSQQATASMQGNYIVALKEIHSYRLATVEAGRMWADDSRVPLFALRALAECYIQIKDIPHAIEVYKKAIALKMEDGSDQERLGFYLLLEGRLVEGLGIYDQFVQQNPGKVTVVVSDAISLLNTEQYVVAKSLFELILKRFPENVLYRRQFADALAKNSLYQSAYTQYEAISRIPNSQVVGLNGMVRTALAMNDYQKAKLALQILTEKYGRSKAVAALSLQYKERNLGEVENSFSYNTSYKGKSVTSWETTADQNINDNLWLLAGIGRTRLENFNIEQSQMINSQSIGVRYQDLHQNTEFLVGKNDAMTSFSTFRLISDHSVTDQVHVKLEVSRSPVEDVEALNQAKVGSVLVNTYALSVSKTLSNKENVTLGVSRSLFTDNNQGRGFSLEHNYTLYTKGDDALTRNLYWNRSWFARQDVVYESPAVREAVGAGWTLRRNTATGYWLGRFVANWDRDYPDSLAFNPYVRLEYNHDFSSTSSLRIGTEYGIRTNSALGKGGLHYGYRQFDVLYNIRW